MALPKLSAAISEIPEIPALHALPSPPPPLWDALTTKKVEVICAFIRQDGLADHLAGALAGIPKATMARWKAEDEAFALKLEEARARFELTLLRQIRDARKSDGSLDWRAQAWLARHASAEGLAKPARARQEQAGKPAAVAAQKCAIPPDTTAAPPAAAADQVSTERRAPGSACESASIHPGNPGQPVRAGQAAAPLTGRIVLVDPCDEASIPRPS